MDKTTRQQIGINKWIEANAIGTFDWTMRFGKTLGGLKIAKKSSLKFPNEHILIVVPSIVVKDVWNKALEEFEHNFNGKLEVTTIDRLLNLTEKLKVKLLIIDEIHKFTSIRRLELIEGKLVEARYKLGLTGTYPHDNRTINKYYPVVDVITEPEAIAEGWISQFIEYNIPLQLTDADKADYIRYTKNMARVFNDFKGLRGILAINDKPFFKSDLDLILSCYKGKDVKGHSYIQSNHIRQAIAVKMGWTPSLDLSDDYNKQIEDYWNPANIKDRVTLYYKAMMARNEIHNINEVKLNAVLQLYNKYKNNTLLIFNESTIFADMISDGINNMFKTKKAVPYHSNIDSKPLVNFINGEYFTTKDGKIKRFGKVRQLKYIISMLKLGVYNCISTVKALDEGLNVDTIDIIITTAGTVNPMQYSQRSARGKTVDKYNPNKVTLIFNLYFDDFMFMYDGEYKQFKSRDATKLRAREGNRDIQEITLSKIIENN